MQYKVEVNKGDGNNYKKKAMLAFMSLREQAEMNFPHGMSLDEINEEICRARYEGEDTE